MVGMEFFGNVDLASVAIWGFWLFFALLIYYLQTENQREGYPLKDDEGNPSSLSSVLPLPADKTYNLPHGRGTLTVPSDVRPERENLALERSFEAGGSPYVPTGDPMMDGVGPAAWVARRDEPELDAHGHAKIRPISELGDFRVAAGRDPRGLAVVAGDGEVIGRVTDMMVDASEAIVRFLVVDVNPEGSGKLRMMPMGMVKVKFDRVVVRSLYSHNFDGIPQTASMSQITKLEEDKIMAYFAGGTLYADPRRIEPAL